MLMYKSVNNLNTTSCDEYTNQNIGFISVQLSDNHVNVIWFIITSGM